MRRIDDGVDPEAGRGVARVGLGFVGGADVAAHYGEARRGPCKHKSRIVGFAAHSVIPRAEAAAANYGNFWNDAVGDGVYHFRAGANDSAPLRVFADHEAVHVVHENQRNAVLIAIENEARGFFRRLSINYAAKFDAFLVRAASQALHVFFLILGHPAGTSASVGAAAKQRFAVFRAVFLEFAGVHDAGNDFPHVVLLAGIA